MSKKYIVRQPIKNIHNSIIGYELLYHGENSAFSKDDGSSDYAAADTIYKYLMLNTEKVLQGALNFMTFTTTLLVKKTPNLFSKEDLVIQIDDSVLIHPLAMHMVRKYARDGYKIAVNEFRFAPRYMAELNTIDYIKIDVASTSDAHIKNIIETAHSQNITCIAINIETEELYNKAAKHEFNSFQGSYVGQKISTKAHSGEYLQSNFFRLMVAVTKDDPNIDEIEGIINVDASLTYGILKVVNSVHFALRYKVTNIKQAITIMGLTEMKRWVYLLSLADNDSAEDSEATEQFLRLSFLRASFCSRLSEMLKRSPITKQDAYLMGMFSTLPYLIDAPFEEILAQIPIVEEIKLALLNKEGKAGQLYSFVLDYENANWVECEEISTHLGLEMEEITNIYFDCVSEVNGIWDELIKEPDEFESEDEF